MSEIEKNIIV